MAAGRSGREFGLQEGTVMERDEGDVWSLGVDSRSWMMDDMIWKLYL